MVDPVEAEVRTATTALHLINLGELVEQSRGLSCEGGAVDRLRQADPSSLDAVVAQPVLTAHPTEARRRALLSPTRSCHRPGARPGAREPLSGHLHPSERWPRRDLLAVDAHDAQGTSWDPGPHPPSLRPPPAGGARGHP
jgi:hypothetical protein